LGESQLKKIRVVIPTVYTPDCPTIHSRLLPMCSELVCRGFEFVFLVMGKDKQKIKPGITYKGYRNYFELVKEIIKLNKKETHIIFASKSYSITGGISYLTAKLKKLGFVLDVDDRIFPSEIIKWWRLPLYFQEWMADRLLLLFKPTTIVASKALVAYYGKNSIYIPNSTSLNNFKKDSGASMFIREKYQIQGHVIIWPAVFFQEIDRHYIFEIFSHIQMKKGEVTLLVIGDGEYLSSIKRTTENMGLSNVMFAGRINYSEMALYYSGADAGIIPLRNTHYDACKGPIKLYEYMAMELPVITTPIGEPGEMVKKAKCGVLIPFDNADQASNIIINLFKSQKDLLEMGKKGRRYLKQFQQIKIQAEKLYNILKSKVGLEYQ